MTRKLFIQAVINAVSDNAQFNMTKKLATKISDAFFQTLSDQLRAKGAIKIHNFGTFRTVCRAARRGRNPQTGESIVIPESKRVAFKSAMALKKEAISFPIPAKRLLKPKSSSI